MQLLRTERQGCCKKNQEPPPEKCFKSSQELSAVVHESGQGCFKEDSIESKELEREDSPQITCCHSVKVPSESQEQIIK